jgi:hypothetical protein
MTGGVGPDRIAPCSPAIGVDHGHAAIGASEGGKFEFSFADETTVLVEHAGRVKPTVAGATKRNRVRGAGGDTQALAVELHALDLRTLSGVIRARLEARQQRGRIERFGPDLDPAAEAVGREGKVGVIAGVDQYPAPALEQTVDHVLAVRAVWDRAESVVVVDLHGVDAVEARQPLGCVERKVV